MIDVKIQFDHVYNSRLLPRNAFIHRESNCLLFLMFNHLVYMRLANCINRILHRYVEFYVWLHNIHLPYTVSQRLNCDKRNTLHNYVLIFGIWCTHAVVRSKFKIFINVKFDFFTDFLHCKSWSFIRILILSLAICLALLAPNNITKLLLGLTQSMILRTFDKSF